MNDDLSVFEERPDIFSKDMILKAKLCKDIAEWRLDHKLPLKIYQLVVIFQTPLK